MRAPQILCGVALVPLAGALAWRAVRDAPAAALFAFSIAGAPFLVMWSRFARPYAMTPLLALIAIACIWAWRTNRTRRLVAGAAISSALLAWFHPLAGMFPAIACLFVFLEDVAAPAQVRPRPSWQSLRLGGVVAGAMLVLLAPALIHDHASLSGKTGGDQPTLATLRWLLDVYWGGLPEPAMWATCALAVWGVLVLAWRDARLALYLVALTVLPAIAVALLGALYVHSGQNFGRYILPTQLAWLFFASFGAVSAVRALAGRVAAARVEPLAWASAAAMAAFYLATTPAIEQVTTAGTWYAHLDYHWNYRYRNIVAKRNDPSFTRPRFYREVLEKAPPGTIPVIEAPYIWEAPYDNLAYYATYHHQPETFGMLHDLCGQGLRIGEVPPWDRRFRFSKFVFLHDLQGVDQVGARYLLFHRKPLHARPFPESEACLAKLRALYGEPIDLDDRLAVFDLRAPRPGQGGKGRAVQ